MQYKMQKIVKMSKSEIQIQKLNYLSSMLDDKTAKVESIYKFWFNTDIL